jgi:hypothetical protein
MLEFFEVPNQMIGAIGPVAHGANFDWARQDAKPGLMNLNLIIDEEAFYSVFGSQDATSGYNQTLLNSIELPLLATLNNNQLILPYTMPLSQNTNHGVNPAGSPPVPLGGPPVPLVASAAQLSGAPNFAYPITDQTQFSKHGYLAGTDPIAYQILVAAGTGPAPAPGNRIKAAFAQFLWTRHGGSGYLFSYGSGLSGQNSIVQTQSLAAPYNNATPAERPFHSLAFPDINYTIMRPAALPPTSASQNTVASNPPMVIPAGNTNPAAVANAQAVQYTYTGTATAPLPTTWYLATSLGLTGTPNPPTYYAPFVTANNNTAVVPPSDAGTPAANFPATTPPTPLVYSGDPGVRNPFFNQGYITSAISPPPAGGISPSVAAAPPYLLYVPAYAGTLTNVTPLTKTALGVPINAVEPGFPLPTNVAFPSGSSGAPTAPTVDSVMMPPPIPPARLFQVPDNFGAGLMLSVGLAGINNYVGAATFTPAPGLGYVGITYNGTTGIGNIPPAVSNASDSGDPWINNQIANQALSQTFPMPTYALNNGAPGVVWSGGTYYAGGATPFVSPTGVLPPTQINYAPYNYTGPGVGTPPAGLWPYNGYNNLPASQPRSPYLGSFTGTPAGAPASQVDDRQHPYWRSEMMQKAMNLTTVRTHQYAVWITVGFFEVIRQGDIGMLAQARVEYANNNIVQGLLDLQSAFDVMGPEVGALNGTSVRYRGFFLVDRLKLTGFNPNDTGAWHAAVVYRKVIQ